MKLIATHQACRIEAFDQPTKTITPMLFDEVMKPAKENKLRIITCAYDIESLLEQWIANYFFADAPTSSRRQEFVSQVLTSDWCSFASKRKLALHLVNKCDLLQGKDKNEYEELLRKTMSYRNAFAHGALSTDGRRVKLSYFEGAPKERFLDDEWLTEIEQNLTKCFCITFKLSTGHDSPETATKSQE